MTPEELNTKIVALTASLHEDVLQEVRALVEAGAVNLEAHGNDFRLPKLLYSEALRRIADGYAPLDRAGHAEAAHLRTF